MQKKRFFRKKIKVVDRELLDKISLSRTMTDSEKVRFMSYLGYLTETEQKELSEII